MCYSALKRISVIHRLQAASALSAAIAKNDKLFKVSHESIMKFEIFFIDDEQLEIYI